MPFALAIWPRAALTGILVLASPLLGVALLWLTKELIDQVFIAQQIDRLPFFAAAYMTLVTANALLGYATTRIETGVIEQIVQDVRVNLYRHLTSVSPGSLGKYSVGELLAHLSADVERVELLIFSGPLSVVANLTSALFFTFFLLLLSWPLTLCALLATPLLAFLSLYLSPRVRRASKIARRKATAWMSLAEERLGAAPLIHAFTATGIGERSAFGARVARRTPRRTSYRRDTGVAVTLDRAGGRVDRPAGAGRRGLSGAFGRRNGGRAGRLSRFGRFAVFSHTQPRQCFQPFPTIRGRRATRGGIARYFKPHRGTAFRFARSPWFEGALEFRNVRFAYRQRTRGHTRRLVSD